MKYLWQYSMTTFFSQTVNINCRLLLNIPEERSLYLYFTHRFLYGTPLLVALADLAHYINSWKYKKDITNLKTKKTQQKTLEQSIAFLQQPQEKSFATLPQSHEQLLSILKKSLEQSSTTLQEPQEQPIATPAETRTTVSGFTKYRTKSLLLHSNYQLKNEEVNVNLKNFRDTRTNSIKNKHLDVTVTAAIVEQSTIHQLK